MENFLFPPSNWGPPTPFSRRSKLASSAFTRLTTHIFINVLHKFFLERHRVLFRNSSQRLSPDKKTRLSEEWILSKSSCPVTRWKFRARVGRQIITSSMLFVLP